MLFIVQRGHVRGEASGEGLPGLDAVAIGPGESAFTRTPFGPNSTAKYFTTDSSAAFAGPITP